MPELEKVVSSSDFDDWFSLNDTIMGGSSKAVCRASSKGLSLEGVVVEEKGGFVSCKSPIFSPLLNLSSYQGFELKIEGKGRTCLLYTSPSPRDLSTSRMPSSA